MNINAIVCFLYFLKVNVVYYSRSYIGISKIKGLDRV